MAERAGATIIEILSPHTIMLSEPMAVADHIRVALRCVIAIGEWHQVERTDGRGG